MKMIGKLSFSVDLVGLIGKIIIDIRCAARWSCFKSNKVKKEKNMKIKISNHI